MLSVLCRSAENRVFAPNISVMENNSVVLAIDCYAFSDLVFTKEESVSKVKAARPEGAEAHSPGHPPWVKVPKQPNALQGQKR